MPPSNALNGISKLPGFREELPPLPFVRNSDSKALGQPCAHTLHQSPHGVDKFPFCAEHRSASRARNITRSCRTSLLRCRIGCNDCGSTRPNRANLFASIRSFFRLRRLRSSHINRGFAYQDFVPAILQMTSCTQAEWVPTSRTTRTLHSVPEKIQQRPAASSATVSFRQRFPSRSKMPVVAPLVSQIHAHGQTVQSGAEGPPRECSRPAIVYLLPHSAPAFLFPVFPPTQPALPSSPAAPEPFAFARLPAGSLFFCRIVMLPSR